MNAVPGRPPRPLTPELWAELRTVDLLTLHRMLHLGIADAVRNPSPMNEEEGAWVRAHAFAPHLAVIEQGYPHGYTAWTNCEKGRCWNCMANRCDLCLHRVQGEPSVAPGDETEFVYAPSGMVARLLVRPAGTPCVWKCRCPCPEPPAPTNPPQATRAPRSTAPVQQPAPLF
ncbi:DUF6248 family natural product biosynthesis protein [Nocardiopsis flavescens]|uniref:DUF6248 family natural product biosynthesis protein n=1 Tax=Nocardiopsis flavescens TaxID=758803 RepID=UPI00365031C0